VARTDQAVQEAQALLAHATIRSPLQGVVIDKKVEVGDTVTPGQTLVTIFNPAKMQMLASVRESLAFRLRVGQKVPGRIDALDYEGEATISEIVPEAQAASRSFTVKVVGPCPPGVYTGMFGRIYIPLEDEEIIVVPAAATRRVGQLEVVQVSDEGQLLRRNILTGRTIGADLEVLSGLRPGEMVAVPFNGGEASR
jgi:RND family efflux transporter MFP subunit